MLLDVMVLALVSAGMLGDEVFASLPQAVIPSIAMLARAAIRVNFMSLPFNLLENYYTV